MGRQARAKKPEQFGKGKVTSVQIAYIVDQYLSENLFTQTRSSFRSEASSLISKTPVQEGPKGLMSLETIIDEYVSMKEQKLVMEMEKRKLEQERIRVQTLLQGMQNVMNAYNASASPVVAAASLPDLASAPVSEKLIYVAPQSDLTNASPAGQIVNVSPNARQPWVAQNMSRGPSSFTTPMVGIGDPSSKKRQGSNAVPGAPINTKKSRTRMPNKQLRDGCSQLNCPQPSTLQSSTSGCVANVTPAQGSSVAKVLFHNTTSASAAHNSSSPATPPRAPSAQSDKNASPVGHSSSSNSNNKTTPPDFSSNCTIVSTKTVIVSPYKKETYYSVEKHCSSTRSPAKGDFEIERSIKRNHVKGRLNFDGADEMTSLEKSTAGESSTSESDDASIFDLDLPNLDFNISDLLMDFDLHCEEQDASHQPGLNPCSVETVTSGDLMLPVTSSTTAQAISAACADSYTSMKLVSKCIEITSPAKRASSIQEK
ncbi:hypothetical protein QQ045_003499 [Rhodiola kirilowii]